MFFKYLYKVLVIILIIIMNKLSKFDFLKIERYFSIKINNNKNLKYDKKKFVNSILSDLNFDEYYIFISYEYQEKKYKNLTKNVEIYLYNKKLLKKIFYECENSEKNILIFFDLDYEKHNFTADMEYINIILDGQYFNISTITMLENNENIIYDNIYNYCVNYCDNYYLIDNKKCKYLFDYLNNDIIYKTKNNTNTIII